MKNWLYDEAREGRIDLLHSHGLWMMPNVYPAWVRAAGTYRLIFSPRGMLAPWALQHHALRKKVMWSLFQRAALRVADAFHVTSQAEYDDVRRLGFREAVCVLPNGVDVRPVSKTVPGARRQALYLARIHKVKGVDNLLRAWAAVEAEYDDWELRIAGPDDGGHLEEMQLLARQLRLTRVAFVGPLYGEEKLAAYRRASLYVLPTHSENFGATVAEALAVGTAAIVTKGAPWQGLVQYDAGWWIDIGVEPLIAALRTALSLPEDRLQQIGRNGHNWVLREFSWSSIGEQMAAFYRWLIDGGERPDCVRAD
jgi:glycosyltransferase involved in cell wall biosynthesis